MVKDKFPELKTICSTIQMLDYKKFKSYEDKFKKYDFVVPLNQHTTYEFLKKYEKYASQIIAFFNLRCSNNNLTKCYADYSNIERTQANLKEIKHNLSYLTKEIKNSNIIPSQLKDDKKLQTCYACKRLVYDTNSLENLMRMGIFQFKIARTSKLYEEEIELLKKTYDIIKN